VRRWWRNAVGGAEKDIRGKSKLLYIRLALYTNGHFGTIEILIGGVMLWQNLSQGHQNLFTKFLLNTI
jgi:hypothetical protein